MKKQGILGATSDPVKIARPQPSVTTTTVTTTAQVMAMLSGSMNMNVPDPAAFVTDTVAKNAVKEAIAEVAAVPASYISLEVTVVEERRLESQGFSEGRRLLGNVKVEYTITIPPGAAVTPTTASNNLESQSASQVSSTVQNKVAAAKGADYAVTVASKSTMTQRTELVTTMRRTTILTTTTTT